MTGRVGGVPTSLPRDFASGAAATPMELFPRQSERTELSPGVVVISGWLSPADQRSLVEQFPRPGASACRSSSPTCAERSPDERAVRVPRLALAAVRIQPHRRRHRRGAGQAASVWDLPTRPTSRRRHVRRADRGALRTGRGDRQPVRGGCAARPPSGRRGAIGRARRHHQRGGRTRVFRIVGVERRTAPFVDIPLRSGDLLVFGGPSRRVYHGVPKVYDNTGPRGLGLPSGRLSLTVRETGFARGRSRP